MSVCDFNSSSKGKYSICFVVAVFCSKSFSEETSFPVRNSYLLIFPDNKAEILSVSLSKSFFFNVELSFAQLCY